MAFRQRTKESYIQCRAKASQYAKELGYSSELLALVIHGTIGVAVNCALRELESWELQATTHGTNAANLTDLMSRGERQRQQPRAWPYFAAWGLTSAAALAACILLTPAAPVIGPGLGMTLGDKLLLGGVGVWTASAAGGLFIHREIGERNQGRPSFFGGERRPLASSAR